MFRQKIKSLKSKIISNGSRKQLKTIEDNRINTLGTIVNVLQMGKGKRRGTGNRRIHRKFDIYDETPRVNAVIVDKNGVEGRGRSHNEDIVNIEGPFSILFDDYPKGKGLYHAFANEVKPEFVNHAHTERPRCQCAEPTAYFNYLSKFRFPPQKIYKDVLESLHFTSVTSEETGLEEKPCEVCEQWIEGGKIKNSIIPKELPNSQDGKKNTK